MQMIAEQAKLASQTLKPGTVIIRNPKRENIWTRCIIVGRENRFGQVLYLTEYNLLKPSWMVVSGTNWCVAGEQVLSQSEQIAVRYIRLCRIYSYLVRRIEARHGAFVDVTTTTGINHDGSEYQVSSSEYVEADSCYDAEMAKIRPLLDKAIDLRDSLRPSPKGQKVVSDE